MKISSPRNIFDLYYLDILENSMENILSLNCGEECRILTCFLQHSPSRQTSIQSSPADHAKCFSEFFKFLLCWDFLWVCRQFAPLSRKAPFWSHPQGPFLLCSVSELLCVWFLHERHDFLPNKWKIDCHRKSLFGILLADEDSPSTAWARCFLVLSLLLIDTLLQSILCFSTR